MLLDQIDRNNWSLFPIIIALSCILLELQKIIEFAELLRQRVHTLTSALMTKCWPIDVSSTIQLIRVTFLDITHMGHSQRCTKFVLANDTGAMNSDI